jgi:hypothetical protein
VRCIGLLVLGAALVLAGCGGAESTATSPTTVATQDDPGTTPPDVTPTTEPAAAPSAAPAAGELGSFTVEDQTFAVTSLNRCEPFSDTPGNLDLQAIAQGALLNLPVGDGGTTLDISVQGSAVEAAWGSISFAHDGEPVDFTVTGDRITGDATLTDALGSGTTVEVSFDVAIPEDVNEC